MASCKRFMKGYSQTGLLTLQEQTAVPELIQLRILSNVVWFVGRAVTGRLCAGMLTNPLFLLTFFPARLPGEDDIASLASRAASYVKRIEWLETHRQQLEEMIIAVMPHG